MANGKPVAEPEWIFGTEDYEGDREGMATFRHEGQLYLVSSDQVPEKNRLQVWNITGDDIRRVALIETDALSHRHKMPVSSGSLMPRGGWKVVLS